MFKLNFKTTLFTVAGVRLHGLAFYTCCFCSRLSNLFHGLEEKSPLKADVYLSMLGLAKEADLAQMVITDLDQVNLPWEPQAS